MGLFPAAPEVKLHAPPAWFSGELVSVEVEVIAKAETKIEHVAIRLVAKEGWSIGSGKSRVSSTATTFEQTVTLVGAGKLAAGTTKFQARIGFPADTPPSHVVEPAWAACELMVHVSIPWWPDGRYKFPLRMRRRITDPVVRPPTVMRSTQLTAPADTPRIELGLASSALIAGEVLTGSCAVFHLDDSRPREVELALVPSLQLFGRGRVRERRGNALDTAIQLPAGSAGKSLAFSLAIPANLTPGLGSVTQLLHWHLVARCGSFFGPKVELAVPLEIVDASAAQSTPRLVSSPRVADARVAALLSQFAQTAGWTQASGEHPDHDGDQPAIVREDGDSELRIAYSYRGEAGTFLVGRVSYPSLGLGLSVTPSSTLRHVFFEDIEVEMGSWDRTHHVRARAAEQTVPFLRAAIGPALEAPALGAFAHWEDDGIVYERPVSSLESSELVQLAHAIGEVARVVATAREAITPPPGLVVDLPAWHALARWLRGSLAVGDLSIDGDLDRMPVALGVQWDADRRHLRVAVGHPDSASAAIREVTLALALPAKQALEVASETLVERLLRWPADVVDLHVVDGVASASLLETVDAGRVRELVHELRGLLAALDPEAGPYR